MGKPWSADISRVTVERSDAPKRFTIVIPYYENPRFFSQQLAAWLLYPDDVLPFVNFIVVDDGSPDHPIVDQLADNALPRSMRLFRIHEDRRWNWLAARNIGAHHAADGWLLLTDMDHRVPEETARAIVWGCHDPEAIYVFSRREHTGQVVSPHSASFLMTRQMFWTIGGYDEALSGHYGTDGEFRRRAMKTAPFRLLRDELIRYEYVVDSSTVRYGRKQPQDAEAQRIIAARQADWHPRVLSFPYGEVTC